MVFFATLQFFLPEHQNLGVHWQKSCSFWGLRPPSRPLDPYFAHSKHAIECPDGTTMGPLRVVRQAVPKVQRARRADQLVPRLSNQYHTGLTVGRIGPTKLTKSTSASSILRPTDIGPSKAMTDAFTVTTKPASRTVRQYLYTVIHSSS